ncbi:LUD domain-containing protein [Streptomyces sp. NPDC047117]|uniref:LUD domain-containing protein n=1 Tax=Streptomyces sp. NPDC047117 TaxID=3155379 RepID=UPI0033E0A0EB
MNQGLAELFRDRLAEAGGRAELTASHGEALSVVREWAGDRPVLIDDHPDLTGLEVAGERPPDPWDAEVGVTGVLGAAADTGTLALGPAPGRPRGTAVLPGTHLAVVPLSRLHADYAALIAALGRLDPLPSGLQLVTGPSRSGDIESAMIQGMHGPRAVRVAVYPDV